jgi:hypothetical protein
MTTLQEQQAKIRTEIQGLENIEVEFQGKKMAVNVADSMFYACNFTGLLVENVLALARNEEEVELTGKAVDMIIKEVITEGSMAMHPIVKEVVKQPPQEEEKGAHAGYIKNATKENIAGYQ